MPQKLVIIEDNPIIALDLEMICQDAGWTVIAIAASVDEVKEKFRDVMPDVVLSDMELIGKEDGVDAVTWLKSRNPDLKAIFITATLDPSHLHRISQTEPLEVFSKPLDRERLIKALSMI